VEMSVFEPKSIICGKFYFNVKKSAVESHRLFAEIYDEAALNERTCRNWFRRFKNGDFDVEDKERVRKPKLVEDAELEALFDEDLCQTQEELAETLGVA